MDTKTLQSIAETLWQDYCEIFPALVKFDCHKIVLNNRFTVTAGCNHSDDNIVHLGAKFFKKFSRNMIDVILPHELAHQIDHDLNAPKLGSRHHGKIWQEIMVKIGQNPAAYHTMEI